MDGSGVEDLVPTQGTEDAEMGVVVEAYGGEKVDSKRRWMG